jgi:hypothetical protein
MRVVIHIVSVAVLCACVRLYLGPLTPEAPRPPLPAAGPSREMLVELWREADTVEQRYWDIATESACCSIDQFDFTDRLTADLRARKFRSARLEPRRWGGPAWSFDVSVETDWQGLRTLLDSYQYNFKKMVLIKDLRIQRVADDQLTASFVLIVIANPIQFATAVVNRGR